MMMTRTIPVRKWRQCDNDDNQRQYEDDGCVPGLGGTHAIIFLLKDFAIEKNSFCLVEHVAIPISVLLTKNSKRRQGRDDREGPSRRLFQFLFISDKNQNRNVFHKTKSINMQKMIDFARIRST